jgi:hypothetical protein
LGFAIQLIYFSGEDQVQSYWMAQPLSGRKTAGKTVQSEPPELKPIKKSLRGFLVSQGVTASNAGRTPLHDAQQKMEIVGILMIISARLR